MMTVVKKVPAAALGAALLFAVGDLTVPGSALADPVVYTLSGVTATFSQGTDDLSGSFTFDPLTTTLDSVDITVTGPWFAGAFQVPIGSETKPDSITATTPGFPALVQLTIVFSAPLTGQAASISGISFNQLGNVSTATAVTGTVHGFTEPSSVAEPASALLVGAALLGLAAMRRRFDVNQRLRTRSIS